MKQKEQRLWDYLTKTTGNNSVARKLYNYINRYYRTPEDVERAYSQGVYEMTQKYGKPGKLSDQK